tara:strand:+ start:309 stop:710 length:402 start_codon:yes stop_codon:yes gene_type:complete
MYTSLATTTIRDMYIILNDFGVRVFSDQYFETFEDGWEFLYKKFPVIELEDGKTNDQEDELDSYRVCLSPLFRDEKQSYNEQREDLYMIPPWYEEDNEDLYMIPPWYEEDDGEQRAEDQDVRGNQFGYITERI